MQLDQMVPLLAVADTSRSLDFYTKSLPFRVIQQVESDGQPVWALLAFKAIRLMISQADETAIGQATDRGIVLYFYVPDARRLQAELSTAGHAVGAIERERFGLEGFTMRDPDGYTLAFGSPLMQIA